MLAPPESSPLRTIARIARAATIATPILLLHTLSLAEIAIGLTGALFLLRSALARDWAWLRTPWVRIALAWWIWLIFCSTPGIGPSVGQAGTHSFLEALAAIRFPVFAAACETWVLTPAAARRWLARSVTLTALYIAFQSLLQAFTGRNIQGFRRMGDGELTGPFSKPHAAGPLSRLIFPALLPPAARLLDRGLWGALAAAALTIAAVAVIVLIGQRMPLLLTLLGLLVCALFLPRLRLPVLAAIVAGGALLAASAALSPPTFYRLVTKFSAQMEHFPTTDYGRIAGRALAIAEQHPLTGRGFDGFRTGCNDPRYFRGWKELLGGPPNPADDGGGEAGCNIHPHNHYLEALTDAGLPGLALFTALILAWLIALARGLWRHPDPLRVGLFAAALIHEWPIASASSYQAMEVSGFFFVLLGWGLAEARAAALSTSAISPAHATPTT